MDGLERPGRAAPAARPARRGPDRRSRRSTGPRRPGHRHRRDARRAARACPTSAAPTSRSATRTTTSSGASSPSATGAAGSTRATTRCRGAPRCGTGLSQMEMNEGYQDREDPGLTVRFPLRRPARRGAARLDDDALDADVQRRRGGRRGPRATSGSARATTASGWARARSSRRSTGPFEVVEDEVAGARARRLALRRPVRRPAGRPDGVRAGRATTRTPYEHRVVAWDEVGEDEGTGIVHIAPGLRRRGLPAGQVRSACRSSAPLDEDGRRTRRVRLAERARRPRRRRADRRAPRAASGRFYHLEPYQPPLPALLALRHAAALPPRRRVVHQHGPGLRPAARDADDASRSTPACATRSWRSSTGSGGSRTSATSASSTGSATCTTG